MMPIPKTLLIHVAQVREVTGRDEWGAESLSEPVDVRYVRMEPSTKYIKNKEGEEVRLAGVLFYDCKNSRPRHLDFSDGQVITFNQEKYRVQLIEALYDGRRLHHYELGVVRVV